VFCCTVKRTVPEDVADAEFWAKAYSGSVAANENPMEPVSDIIYPFANEFDSDNIVAVNAATFYWRDVLKNVLPPGKEGLVIVIENPCTASFTYQVE
jgi:hypothetical protein